MAQKKGGAGSAIGCVLFLVVLVVVGVKYYPQIKARLFAGDAPLEWDQAAEEGGLRIRIRLAEAEESYGSAEGTSDVWVKIEVTNLTDTDILYHAPKGATEPKLADDKGRAAPYAPDTGVQLADEQEIASHVHKTHDLVFKGAHKDASHFVMTLDLALFSRTGTIRFRIPAERVTGLK